MVLSQRPDGRYTLVSGLNTLRRMRDAGQVCVDAVTCPAECMERRVARLLDQLMRGRLHYLDEAEEYRALLAAGMDPKELAARIGRTPATFRKKLRLLNLGDEAMGLLREHGLCEGYAQALLRVPGIQGRLRVLRHVIEEKLSVPDTERLVSDVLARMPVPLAGGRHMKPLIRDYRLYVNAIRGVVEQMRDAGLDARMQVNVGQGWLRFVSTCPCRPLPGWAEGNGRLEAGSRFSQSGPPPIERRAPIQAADKVRGAGGSSPCRGLGQGPKALCRSIFRERCERPKDARNASLPQNQGFFNGLNRARRLLSGGPDWFALREDGGRSPSEYETYAASTLCTG